MKTKSTGRRQNTQTLLIVAFSLLCSLYVASRMLVGSSIRNALVDDLNDADEGGARVSRGGINLGNLPRLVDDAAATIGARNVDDSTDGDQNDDTPQLAGQVDGISRGVVHGWGCETDALKPSAVAVSSPHLTRPPNLTVVS